MSDLPGDLPGLLLAAAPKEKNSVRSCIFFHHGLMLLLVGAQLPSQTRVSCIQ